MSDIAQSNRTVDRLLAEYGESHQNQTNKKIHWIAVPAIFWTVVALLWSLPVPAFMTGLPFVNWATVALVLAIAYYTYLSLPLAIGMLAFSLLCMFLVVVFETVVPIALWQGALAVFLIAWIAQFYGHKVEGKKPSFFKDVQFLLIGPAWLMSFIYRRYNISY